ncbi:glycosyltransferase [Corallincola platygyrae]|uniref:Glycosyltransferase n=1 Tax=Corallincola platygyrae TaxID=1193278 RepID=A0ABW4XNY2_9GAMM
MDNQCKVLFVLERFPEPSMSGAASYNWAVLEAIKHYTNDVTLVISGDHFDTPVFSKEKGTPKTGCNKVILLNYFKVGGYYVSKSLKAYLRPLKKLVQSLLKRSNSESSSQVFKIGRFSNKREANSLKRAMANKAFDHVFVDTIFRSPLSEALADNTEKAHLISHDLFYKRCLSFKNNGYGVSPFITEAQEKQVFSKFDSILAINANEHTAISELVPDTQVITLLPTATSTPQKHDGRVVGSSNIMYVGANAHHNIEGLNWLFENVWPSVLDKHGNAKLLVCGSVSKSFDSAPPGVEFLGRVDSLASVAENCAFAVNPVNMGSGIKIKMVDYFSLGLPCITTPVGAYGFPASESGLPFIVASDGKQFADKVCQWLEDSSFPIELSLNTFAYSKLFTPKAAAASLKPIFSQRNATGSKVA